MKTSSVASQKIVTQFKCHSGQGGVIPVFARKCDFDPLFVSPFAKGEIQWGFWQFC
jgi:hypothetical protein